jgi:hypothetical protein
VAVTGLVRVTEEEFLESTEIVDNTEVLTELLPKVILEFEHCVRYIPTKILDVSVIKTTLLAPLVLPETTGVAPVTFAARETQRRFVYDKKFAAVKKVSPLKLVGLPNLETNMFSESTNTLSPIGPQRKTPAKAPSVVATDGTTVVRSISDTFTPGDN